MNRARTSSIHARGIAGGETKILRQNEKRVKPKIRIVK